MAAIADRLTSGQDEPLFVRYSRVEHLARSLRLGRFAWSDCMAMYSAYCDESGHPADSDHMIVAGGLASVEQWVHFEREWREALAAVGLTLFHATDLDQSVTGKAAKDLHERLAGIICRRAEKVFACSLDMKHYRIMNAKWLFAECHGAPYPLGARSCIGVVEGWARKHSVDISEILFFFEDGAYDKGQLEWIAERDQIPIPLFRKKRDLVPLQIGDFIGWHMTQLSTGSDKTGNSESVIRRLEGMSHSWNTMDMSDPDRLPFILEIPERLPDHVYRPRVIQKHGVRRALVHYWRKDRPQDQKLDRKTLELPSRITRSPEDISRAMCEYAAIKASKANSEVS